MTLRSLIAATALLAAPAALATAASARPATDSATNNATVRTPQPTRKVERARPGTPLKSRVIEAPGAALMVIPASYDAARGDPFGPF